jgi:hypothetical protein
MGTQLSDGFISKHIGLGHFCLPEKKKKDEETLKR